MAGRTFVEIVQQQARARPQALAYRCGDRRWTFADVERDSKRITHALAAMAPPACPRAWCCRMPGWRSTASWVSRCGVSVRAA